MSSHPRKRTLLDMLKPLSNDEPATKRQRPPAQDLEFWSMHPRLIADSQDLFRRMLIEVQPLVVNRTVDAGDGRIFESRRVSCKFSCAEHVPQLEQNTNGVSRLFGYESVPWYEWSKSPLVSVVREQMEREFGVKFDYCLLHIYRDGRDGIGWHSDRESMKTPIISVSLGATRKFRFRKVDAKNGYSHEYTLRSGDVLHMKRGCQSNYKHAVLPEASVLGPRINLTFRQFDEEDKE